MRYPLYRYDREAIRLPSGKPIEEFSLEGVKGGGLDAEDLGIHEETLRRQARIAEEAGFRPLAGNLERAAELTRVPAPKILEIYEVLRRGERTTELEALALEVEHEYGATATAAFIREAAARTEPRGRAG